MGTLAAAGTSIIAGFYNQYYSVSDTVATTVTQAVTTALSSVYAIPAGEPQVNSAYELLCGGNGTWGSTAQSLHWGFYLNSTQVGVGQIIAANQFSANAPFRWRARMRVVCVSTGSGATWMGDMDAVVTQTANQVQVGTAADNSVSLADANSSAVTASTLASTTAGIQAFWGSATGAPTITCRSTTFRKAS